MKVALVQIDCSTEDVAANMGRVSTFAKQARKNNCQLVVFPEMTDTGYVPALFSKQAGNWSSSGETAFANAARVAADNSISIVCGLSEKVDNEIYNSLAVFDSHGNLTASYRKLHLFSADPSNEDKYCAAGNKIVTAPICEVMTGLSICYDLRFPEIYRKQTLEGAKILINIAAWPKIRAEHWECLARARAIENQAFVIACNRCGEDGGVTLLGHSKVIDPFGAVVSECGAGEEFLIADLDFGLVEEFRRSIPAVSSRRTDLYGDF